MIDDIKKDAASRMGKSLESLQNDFGRIRTGRAHTSLLDQHRGKKTWLHLLKRRLSILI